MKVILYGFCHGIHQDEILAFWIFWRIYLDFFGTISKHLTNPSSWNERPIWLTFGDAGDDECLKGDNTVSNGFIVQNGWVTEYFFTLLGSHVHIPKACCWFELASNTVVEMDFKSMNRWVDFLDLGIFIMSTPPKINIELENDGLEDDVPLPRVSC